MKKYYPSSLCDLDPGPWRPDPHSIYWSTETGLVAIPEWTGTHWHWDRWNNVGSWRVQRRKAKIVRTHITEKGYVRTVGPLVHVVVARAWVPNFDGKPQVNHKDGNKQNNHVHNLEWVTNSENQLHRVQLRKTNNGN